MREAFSKFGRLVDCRIARTGSVSRGFGFVTFDDPRDAEDALERYCDRISATARSAGTL